MYQHKIMNIFLSNEVQFIEAPGLLVHATKPFICQTDESTVRFAAGGHYDFMTYFNALSVRKWREYTVADEFGLHLEFRGGGGTVFVTEADAFDYGSRKVGDPVHLAPSNEWESIEIDLPSSSRNVLEAFSLFCDGDVELRNSYYFAKACSSEVRQVELAICTTTFKKEEYITRNIDLIRNGILQTNDRASDHVTMHVVDNGRTLNADELKGDRVYIHPNPNAGGAGGFARGMIEAMEQTPRATHVLLMDDDVLVSPESILRTYSLLSLLREDYSEAFVSGAMMNMEEPSLRWEEMGFVGFDGAFHPVKPVAHMTTVHDVVDGEAYDIPSYMPRCEDQEQTYAAWWYCVIPMTQIDRNGLPLPVFVRGDDVEYSRRCKPRFMSMNGICIWHNAFHTRYSAAQERYQMTRNCFIDQFVSDIAPQADFMGSMKRAFRAELNKFNYSNAELILRGFEDFLKGPSWIMQPNAQQAFMDANRDAEKLVPFAELESKLEDLGIALSELTDWKVWRDLPYSREDRMVDRFTHNGQTLGSRFTVPGKVAVIDHVGWSEADGKIRGAEIIVALDMPNKRGAIRRINRARFKELVKRYNTDIRFFERNKNSLLREYRAARKEMTSVAFWRDYLGMN